MDSATTFPPEESQLIRKALARNTAMTVPIVEMIASSKVHAKPARSRSNPTATEARQKIEMIIQSTAKPNNKKR